MCNNRIYLANFRTDPYNLQYQKGCIIMYSAHFHFYTHIYIDEISPDSKKSPEISWFLSIHIQYACG